MADDLRPGLFDSDPDRLAPAEPREEPAPGVARARLPKRMQLELRPRDLDALLPEGHRARVVWAWVERADLSRMYADIRSVEGASGHAAIIPEILFALWLYATLNGVGTARSLAFARGFRALSRDRCVPDGFWRGGLRCCWGRC